MEFLISWISNVPAENTVGPTDLALFLHGLLSSVDENTFVIVDGLEYLILNNGFESVMKFLTNPKYHTISSCDFEKCRDSCCG